MLIYKCFYIIAPFPNIRKMVKCIRLSYKNKGFDHLEKLSISTIKNILLYPVILLTAVFTGFVLLIIAYCIKGRNI